VIDAQPQIDKVNNIKRILFISLSYSSTNPLPLPQTVSFVSLVL
jgi:hypothetical protein